MKIVAKQIEHSNIVFLFPQNTFGLPEAADFFRLYKEPELKGSNFIDDPVLRLRVFEFQAMKFKWMFEPDKVRLDDLGFRRPEESKLGEEFARVIASVAKRKPAAVGFNYDVIFKTDTVIPMKDIMANFIGDDEAERVRDFGWQYSVNLHKGAKTELYFFKAVSPLELAVHVNVQFQGVDIPEEKNLGKLFEQCYTDIDTAVKRLSF